jgi:hypothetical protein
VSYERVCAEWRIHTLATHKQHISNTLATHLALENGAYTHTHTPRPHTHTLSLSHTHRCGRERAGAEWGVLVHGRPDSQTPVRHSGISGLYIYLMCLWYVYLSYVCMVCLPI